MGACTVDAILKVERIPSGDVKGMAEDGVVIGAGMAVAAACTASMLGGSVSVWGRIGSDKVGDFFYPIYLILELILLRSIESKVQKQGYHLSLLIVMVGD